MDITALMNGGDDLYLEMIKENLEQRILIINDEITESVVEDYILYILKWNKEDKHVPIEERTPITIYINSVGGSVIDGGSLIDVIEVSTTPIRAVVYGLAASMAFRIFICCNERIAFKNSVLLMHDGEISISNSTNKAKDTMRFVDAMEERTKQFVLRHTSMDEDFYDKHYDQEFYMFANGEGRTYGCVDKIIGEDVSIEYLFA